MICKTRKVRHETRGAAEAHLRSIWARDASYQGVAYPCDQCVGWHVGREKKRAYRSKYQAGSR